MSERHRVKIADMDGNFLYLNLRLPKHEVEAFVALINGPTSGAARYERALDDHEEDEA